MKEREQVARLQSKYNRILKAAIKANGSKPIPQDIKAELAGIKEEIDTLEIFIDVAMLAAHG